jgi:hypothetical protein
MASSARRRGKSIDSRDAGGAGLGASRASLPNDSTPASNSSIGGHGASVLSSVDVDTYNAELRDGEGFIGDRASARAFRAILSDERERAAAGDDDPIGEVPSEKITKKKLDKLITEGDPKAAGVVLGTIEEFAQEFATVIRRFMRLKAWSDTRRILIGGGLRASRIGELAIGRTAVLLRGSGHELELRAIRHHPDEAGLIGSVHLAPSWIFQKQGMGLRALAARG